MCVSLDDAPWKNPPEPDPVVSAEARELRHGAPDMPEPAKQREQAYLWASSGQRFPLTRCAACRDYVELNAINVHNWAVHQL